MTTIPPTHEQERQAILKEYPLTYFIAAAALFIVLGIAIGALLFGQNSPLADADNNYFSNVYLTIISTAFTVIVIDRLNRRRDEQRAEHDLKAQLLRDVRSTSNETAKNAVHQLQERDWLGGETGLLKGAYLSYARLQGAFLMRANLQGAKLFDSNLQNANLLLANLQDAELMKANLQDAELNRANLQDAILYQANLQGALLMQTNIQSAELTEGKLQNANLLLANLQGAFLMRANLQGAKLLGANLQDANLIRADMDESTILPDDTPWTPDTDMTRFTDPNHPNFWRSNNPGSPAFRGAGAVPTTPGGEQP